VEAYTEQVVDRVLALVACAGDLFQTLPLLKAFWLIPHHSFGSQGLVRVVDMANSIAAVDTIVVVDNIAAAAIADCRSLVLGRDFTI